MDILLRFLFFEDVTRDNVKVVWPPRFPHLESPLHVLLFLAIAAGAVAMVVFFYKREPDYVSPSRKKLLITLRSLGLITLLFALTGAAFDFIWEEVSQGTLVLLFDTSQSMSFADKRTRDEEVQQAAEVMGTFEGSLSETDRELINKTMRIQLVQQAMANPKIGLLHQLKDKYKIAAFTFGESSEISPLELKPVKEAGGPLSGLGAADEGATRLGSALRDASARLKGQLVIGVIPFTDGGSNRGEDPVLVAQDLHMPVYPVGVGLTQTRDVEIPFLFAENVIFKGDTFFLYVRIKQRGYEGQSTRLLIRQDDVVIDERNIQFGVESELTQVIQITPEAEGNFTYSAEIEPFDDEMSKKNNQKSKAGIRVVDKKIKVLVIEDAPRWEFRFLMSVMLADKKRIDPTFILREADIDLIRQSRGEFRRQFPTTVSELRPYNLIILGDILSKFFTHDELKNLEQYVREEGGTLLALAGQKMPSQYDGTPVQDMLPIEFIPQSGITAQTEAIRTITVGFRPRLTPEGRRSPVFSLSVDADLNDRLWEDSSLMYWFYPAERLKPGATSLLEHPHQSNRYGNYPLVARHRYGRGQVMYFGIDETWRWRFRPGPDQHRRLWGQIISTLSMSHLLGKTNRIQIDTDREEYTVGDKVKLIPRVLDQDYDPLEGPTVTAVVERSDLEKVEVTLAGQQGHPGVFQGEFVPEVEGAYRVVISGEEEETEHSFNAVVPRIEFDDPGMRKELLEQVAAASDGRFVPLHELSTLADELKAREHHLEARREEKTLWDAPGIVVIFTILMGLEWFIRKRSDLL